MTPPVQFQPAPQQQPTQGQPATPPMDPRPVTGAELQRRIQHGDQNFPPELWGRTMGEAMRYYAIMRQDFVQRQAAAQSGQQPLQGQPTQQPQRQFQDSTVTQQRQGAYVQPLQPQYQQPQQPTGYIPPQQQAPAEVPLTLDAVQRVVEQTLSRAMAPMAQASAASVQQQMRGRFGDWAIYEQGILTELQGADPTALLNPGLWESAYYYVKGKSVSENPPRQQAPIGYGQPQVNPSYPGGPIFQPVPADFFSEAPTAPAVQPNANGQLNDPNDEVYARRFGMPVEEYRAWKGGRVPVPQRQQQQQPNPNGGGGGWR